MTEINVPLQVYTIIESTENGYSRVVLGRETFDAIRGSRPALPSVPMQTATGKRVFIFDFGGVKVIKHWDGEARRTLFLMRTEDAVSAKAATPGLPVLDGVEV